MRLLAAEFRKLTYQRAMWGLLTAAVLFSALGTAATAVIFDQSSDGLGFGTLKDQMVVDSVYANAISGYIFAVLVGVLIVAGEFRHGTAVATYVAAPRRGQVFIAKLIASLVAGVVLMIVSTAGGIAGGMIALEFYPEAADPSVDIFVNTSLAAIVSGAVLGVLGASIAALIRSQIISLIGVLIWLFAIEPILLLLFPDQGKFFLQGLITAIMALDVESEQFNLDTADFADPLTATLLLLGYAAVFAILSMIVSIRRDVE